MDARTEALRREWEGSGDDGARRAWVSALMRQGGLVRGARLRFCTGGLGGMASFGERLREEVTSRWWEIDLPPDESGCGRVYFTALHKRNASTRLYGRESGWSSFVTGRFWERYVVGYMPPIDRGPGVCLPEDDDGR